MDSILAVELGINSDVMHWVIVPLLIFIARICDVSINTLRVMFMLSGRKGISTILGFLEALIWLLAISQILQNIGSVITYIAYAGGFATGIYVGILIEDRLAIGTMIVRIITQKDASELIEALKEKGFGLTYLDALGKKGKVNIIFTITKRKNLDRLLGLIEQYNPNAMYTIEGLKHAREYHDIMPESRENPLRRVRGMIRK
ncbi:DUF2179 domain-containing protein [Flammeovirgaceae bacterium SG7u.111]|nr:DUF2179 domain-containing protein [Flammeovirgaceae bacterium SG7u.132]WPO35383.1 DUF2179 domain-containing protein [Flammeovirgaceae bacterium SG7u.111]